MLFPFAYLPSNVKLLATAMRVRVGSPLLAMAAVTWSLLHGVAAWNQWVPPSGAAEPGPRYGHSIHVFENYTYLFGGRCGSWRCPRSLHAPPCRCDASGHHYCVVGSGVSHRRAVNACLLNESCLHLGVGLLLAGGRVGRLRVPLLGRACRDNDIVNLL